MRNFHIVFWFTIIICSTFPVIYLYFIISSSENVKTRNSFTAVTESGKVETDSLRCATFSRADLLAYPLCEEKLKWLKTYWNTHACYSEYGVDGSICSFRSYLSTIELFCPPLPGYPVPSYHFAKMNTNLSDLLAFLTDNPENYSFIQSRLVRMFDKWVTASQEVDQKYRKVMSSRRKLNVIIHMGFLNKENKLNFASISDKGGPLGELVQWTDLIAAMHILGHQLFISSERKTLSSDLRIFKNAPPCPSSIGKVDLIVTDIMGLRSFRNHKEFLLNNKCRLRLIDSFGTHVEFNTKTYFNAHKKEFGGSIKNPWGGHGLNLQQYWTLFPHTPDNSFLGFVVEKAEVPALFNREKRKSVLIYGKQKYIWQSSENVISTLKELTEVHATVSDADNSTMFQGIVNHGFLNSSQFYGLLNSVRVFVGLGFPFEGPAPLEAIANGAVFINPRYPVPKSRSNTEFLKEKPTLRKWTSQIPYCERIGEPYVVTVDIHDKEALTNAIRKALDTKLPGFIPEEFTMQGMLLRMALMTDKQDFCNPSVIYPDIRSLKNVLGASGDNCEHTCERQDLVCEPAFFKVINNQKVMKNFNNCKLVDRVSSVTAPFNCTLQSTEELFSCASYPINNSTSRICPCRDHITNHLSICKYCV